MAAPPTNPGTAAEEPSEPGARDVPEPVVGIDRRMWSEPDSDSVPRWADQVALVGASALATVGLVGMALTLFDRFDARIGLAAGLIVGLLVLLRSGAAIGEPRATTTAHRAALVALAIALAYGAFAARAPSSGVVLHRDPSSYVNTGRWLADNDSLRVDAAGDAFEGIEGVRYASPAVYDVSGKDEPPGQIRFQFNHLVAVLLASAHTIGGDELMIRLPAAMGAAALYLLYLLAVRVTRRPVLSLIAPALLATNLAMLHVIRNTYSEGFTLAFALSAAVAGSHLLRRPRPLLAAVAGLCLGAATATRIDALIMVAILIPIAGLGLITALRDGHRPRTVWSTWATLATTTALGVAIGWRDLYELAGNYPRDLGPELSQLRRGTMAALVVTVIGVAAIVLLRDRVRPIIERLRNPVATVAGALVVALLLFGWFVRPHLGEASGRAGLDNPTVKAIQSRDGSVVDGSRSYGENSVSWMAWYLGVPAFTAAVAGLGLGVRDVLRRRVSAAHWITLALCLGTGALYWWAPRNTPDHPWVMRRYIPGTLPLLTIWATYLLARASSILEGRSPFQNRSARMAAGLIAAAVILVPSAMVMRPLYRQQQQTGYTKVIKDACRHLPDRSAVVLIGAEAELTLPQSFRSWCGVPTVGSGSYQGTEALLELRDEVAANGHVLTLVATSPNRLWDASLHSSSPMVETIQQSNPLSPQAELEKVPDRYLPTDRADPIGGTLKFWILPMTCTTTPNQASPGSSVEAASC